MVIVLPVFADGDEHVIVIVVVISVAIYIVGLTSPKFIPVLEIVVVASRIVNVKTIDKTLCLWMR